MAGEQIDRINGLIGSIAIKAPCAVVTLTNIAKSGPATLGSYSVLEDDRVLQAVPGGHVDNGIWKVSLTGTWARSADFDGARDAVNGTIVPARRDATGAIAYSWYELTTETFVIGEDALTFNDVNLSGNQLATNLASATGTELVRGTIDFPGAEPRLLSDKLGDEVSIKDFGAVCDGITDDTDACNAALASGAKKVRFLGTPLISNTLWYRGNTEINFDTGAYLIPTPIAGWTLLNLNGLPWGYGMFVNENWESATIVDENITFINVRCQPTSHWNGQFIVNRRTRNLKLIHSKCISTTDVIATMKSVDTLVYAGWCRDITNCAYDFWEECVNVTVVDCTGYNVNAGINFNSVDTSVLVGADSDGFLANGNRFYNCASAGIFVAPLGTNPIYKCKNITIINNFVDQNLTPGVPLTTYHGITVQNSAGVLIRGNILSRIGLGSAPIVVTQENGVDCTGVTVDGNLIVDSAIGTSTYIAVYGVRARVINNKALNSTATGGTGIAVSSPDTYVGPNDMTGATTYLANATAGGTPTTPALEYRADTANSRHRFMQAVRTDAEFQQLCSYGVTATGTLLSDALALTTPYVVISGGAANTGVALQTAPASRIGAEKVIKNRSGSDKRIWANTGDSIEGSPSITIANNTTARLVCITANIWERV